MAGKKPKLPTLVSAAGGTGRYSLLKGLKNMANIVALYNITDSGGSSGILRVEHGVLPPGDGIQALAALAKSEADEIFLLDRFSQGRVNGHRIGNLMYEAATRKFGNDLSGIRYLQKLFKIGGHVYPVSDKRGVDLVVELEDGSILVQEHRIDTRGGGSPIVNARLSETAEILPEVARAIEKADIILFGPGDLWTSIIPHLLVKGIPEAIKKSKAQKVMVCNLVTKPGETEGYTASRFAEIVTKFLDCQLDDFIVNSNHLNREVADIYRNANQHPVVVDRQRIKMFAKRIHEMPLATVIESGESKLIRHHPDKTAQAVLTLISGKKKTPLLGPPRSSIAREI